MVENSQKPLGMGGIPRRVSVVMTDIGRWRNRWPASKGLTACDSITSPNLHAKNESGIHSLSIVRSIPSNDYFPRCIWLRLCHLLPKRLQQGHARESRRFHH